MIWEEKRNLYEKGIEGNLFVIYDMGREKRKRNRKEFI